MNFWMQHYSVPLSMMFRTTRSRQTQYIAPKCLNTGAFCRGTKPWSCILRNSCRKRQYPLSRRYMHQYIPHCPTGLTSSLWIRTLHNRSDTPSSSAVVTTPYQQHWGVRSAQMPPAPPRKRPEIQSIFSESSFDSLHTYCFKYNIKS